MAEYTMVQYLLYMIAEGAGRGSATLRCIIG